MAPFVCCLRFEAVATFCQVLLVGVTISNLLREHLVKNQSRNAVGIWEGTAKNELHILKPEAIPDAKKKDSIPIGQSHASLSHPEFFGGGLLRSTSTRTTECQKKCSTKSISKHVTRYHSFSLRSHPEKFQGEKPMDFPPSI